jgi:hypothetical protein
MAGDPIKKPIISSLRSINGVPVNSTRSNCQESSFPVPVLAQKDKIRSTAAGLLFLFICLQKRVKEYFVLYFKNGSKKIKIFFLNLF